jgi:hypothetical protein
LLSCLGTNAKITEVIEFMFIRGKLNARHGIGSRLHWFGAAFYLNVNLFVWVYTQRAVKELLMVL